MNASCVALIRSSELIILPGRSWVKANKLANKPPAGKYPASCWSWDSSPLRKSQQDHVHELLGLVSSLGHPGHPEESPLTCRLMGIYSLQWKTAASAPLKSTGTYWLCVHTCAKACRAFTFWCLIPDLKDKAKWMPQIWGELKYSGPDGQERMFSRWGAGMVGWN